MLNYTHYRPRRRAMANVDQAATASVVSFAQLFNNSNSAELLMVLDFSLWVSTTNFIFVYPSQTGLSGTAGTALPFVAGEATPPGVFSQGTAASAATSGYKLSVTNQASLSWPHNYPFLVLPPNWYMTIICNAVNLRLIASVTWEAITPEQLAEDRYLAQLASLAPNDLP